jgi:hypothetical protein
MYCCMSSVDKQISAKWNILLTHKGMVMLHNLQQLIFWASVIIYPSRSPRNFNEMNINHEYSLSAESLACPFFLVGCKLTAGTWSTWLTLWGWCRWALVVWPADLKGTGDISDDLANLFSLKFLVTNRRERK